MPADGLWGYKRRGQFARIVTESWGEQNLYCPNCPSPKLDRRENRTASAEFACPRCGFGCLVRRQGRLFGRHITAVGGYDDLKRSMEADQTPNFFFMNYDGSNWLIRDLLLVPHFAFPASAIVKREPLGPDAFRAGWVGCNFDLRRIPIEAQIHVVREGEVTPAAEVRRQFTRVKPLKDIPVAERGWTLDVLNLTRRLVDGRGRGNESKAGKSETNQGLLTSSPANEFTNNDAYAFASELEQLHPDNRQVKDKIRQQLQVLCDAKLLTHVSAAVWRLP